MEILTIFLIAIGLCFDSFAVSVSTGLIIKDIKISQTLKVATFLGFFQALMPFLGWLVGKKLKEYIANFDHWIAFALLLIIGGKMIFESMKNEEEKTFNPLKIIVLIGISIATSIDAFVVGITFGLLNISILLAVLIIGFVTFSVGILGIYIGRKTGNRFGNKMEIFGGIVLILIGIKILIEHLFF